MQNSVESPISLSSEQRLMLLRRYGRRHELPRLNYGTVEDFCDSSDHVPYLTTLQGDLKDLQRPSALKNLISLVPPQSSLLEIGAGEPYVAHVLNQLGYHVTVVDPYDGSGRGPTEFEYYVKKYPDVKIVRSLFSESLPEIDPGSVDCIYSISVLEHVHQPGLSEVFAGIRRYLRRGGYSLHLIDHVLKGEGEDFHHQHLAEIISLQAELAQDSTSKAVNQFAGTLNRAAEDVDTYFLSADGHNRWRGAMPYSSFRFRKVISITSCSMYGSPSVSVQGAAGN